MMVFQTPHYFTLSQLVDPKKVHQVTDNEFTRLWFINNNPSHKTQVLLYWRQPNAVELGVCNVTICGYIMFAQINV
jgi:hypothetical protein